MADHVLKRFDEELNKLRYRLVKMGTLVQQQIELAVSALLNDNSEQAKLVLSLEDKVDKLDIKIDKQCLRIFALHQPVAMDLRLVLSAVSMNDNMELIGDLASNVANNVLALKASPGLIKKTKLEEMGRTLGQIISKLMDSFVNFDIELAIESIKMDAEINNLFKENFKLLTDIMKTDGSLIDSCCLLLDINRNIQAISRQAISIAQELVFLVEARLIKHQNIDDLKTLETEDLNSQTDNDDVNELIEE